jgi:hypothetical protein
MLAAMAKWPLKLAYHKGNLGPQCLITFFSLQQAVNLPRASFLKSVVFFC